MHKKIRWAVTSIILAIALVNLNCTAVSSNEEKQMSKTAPDFTLSDLRGVKLTLSQFKDKNVLMVFGATWCPYCVEEIPELKEIHNKYKDEDLKLLYIDINESKEKVAAFAKRYDIHYTVLLDTTGEVASSYGVHGIPHQVLIAKGGYISYEGPRPSRGIMSLVEKFVKERR